MAIILTDHLKRVNAQMTMDKVTGREVELPRDLNK